MDGAPKGKVEGFADKIIMNNHEGSIPFRGKSISSSRSRIWRLMNRRIAE